MIKKISLVFFCIVALIIISGTLISCKNPFYPFEKDAGVYKGIYSIGDTGPGGGIIFYYSSKGFMVQGYNFGVDPFTSYKAHYLEVASVEQGNLEWASTGWYTTDIQGTEKSLGKGKANTVIILSEDANAPAAKACADYRGGGKTDWFLPSLDELNKLYMQKGLISFTTGDYWSSSQYDSDCVWVQFLFDGSQIHDSFKYNLYYVRPIRAF